MAGMNAHHRLPPPDLMMQLITGYWVSQAEGGVARLGVADQLAGGPRSSAEIAEAVGARPRLATTRQQALLAATDLNMLVMLGGRERTEVEYRSLLEQARFRMDRVIPTHSPFSVIEATQV